MPHCCNVFINWVSAVLKVHGDRVQQVKCNHFYFGQKPVLGGIPHGNALGPLLSLIYVNYMLLQIKNGSLLQLLTTLVWSAMVMIIHRLRTFWGVIYIPWLDRLLQVRSRLTWKNLVWCGFLLSLLTPSLYIYIYIYISLSTIVLKSRDR